MGRLVSYGVYEGEEGESSSVSVCFVMPIIDDRESAATVLIGDMVEDDEELQLYPYNAINEIYDTIDDKIDKHLLTSYIGNTGWDDSNFQINVIDNTEDFSLNNYIIQVLPEFQDINNTWTFSVKDFNGSMGSYSYNKSALQIYDIYDSLIVNPSGISQGLYLVEKTGSGVNSRFNIKPFLTNEHVNNILTNNYYTQDEIEDRLEEFVPNDMIATQSTNGLLSASDKRLLDSLNPNVETTISNLNTNELGIINAKEENLLGIVIDAEPLISERIRTSNLLDVSDNYGSYYIGSNGAINASTPDLLGGFIPVTPGQVIYYTGHVGETTASSVNRRLHVYTSNQTWIKQLNAATSLRVGQDWSTYGTVPANGAYIRVSWGVTDTNVMISVGAPVKYEPYYITPFAPITSVDFQIGATSDPEDATTYTFNVPSAAGDQYGFTFDPVQGKLWQNTGHISSYDGETLPGYWWSDRDVYEEGSSPQTGAEVIYRLEDEDVVEYNCTSMTIPLNYHVNYFFTEEGFIQSIHYYADTVSMDHLTIGSGMTFGETNILESDVIGWNNAADLIDTKANLVGAQLTGNVTAPTLGISNNSDRIATTAFVQQHMRNLAPYEASAKASKNYSVGDYLTYAGYLYKVTAAIAQNTSLTVGTNVEITDVATELNALRSLIQS